jgi:hypothetical protein
VERAPKSPKHAPKKEAAAHGKKGFPRTVKEAKEAMPRSVYTVKNTYS